MEDSQVNSKYDRQIRLWSTNGQSSITGAKLLVIGLSCTTTETIKNLVLPGLGHIELFDPVPVNDDDLGNNFFLMDEDLGTKRDKALALRLNELNPDVQITASTKASLTHIISDLQYLKQFDCILIDSLSIDLIDTVFPYNIPIVHTKSIGFYGSIKIYIKEHTIVEAHTGSLEDLRLDSPWTELIDYVESLKIESLDQFEFAKIPYSILLIKLIQDFKNSNNGIKPTTKQLRDFIGKLYKIGDEANLEEAYSKAFWVNKDSSKLPNNVESVFQELSLLTEEEVKQNKFWILAQALKLFYEKYNTLPISGVLPDMESNTEQYIALQEIYKQKFQKDKIALLQEINSFSPEVTISDQELTTFTKNCKCIQVQRTSKELINSSLISITSPSDYNIYVGFLALGECIKLYSKFPDRSQLRAGVISLLCTYKTDSFPEDLENILDELLRSKGKELHNIASIIGGVASQEIIKLITHQYIPLDDCLVFNGIKSHANNWKT